MITKEEFEEAIEHYKEDPCVNIKPLDFEKVLETALINIIIRGKDETPYERGSFKFRINLREEFRPQPQSIRLSDFDFDLNMSVGEFKRELRRIYRFSPVLAIQLLFKGKVLPDQLRLERIGIHPSRDVITIMATHAGYPKIWNKGKVFCETMIWHPNIDCSLSPESENFFLGKDWDCYVSLTKLLEGIKSLIHTFPPIFDSSMTLNKKAAEQLLEGNNESFKRKAIIWNKKYVLKRDINGERFMFIDKEWTNLLPDNPGVFIIFDFDNEPLIINNTRSLSGDIAYRIRNYVLHNFMYIDFHDLAKIKYWVCQNEEQAEDFMEIIRERYRGVNPFLKPNRSRRNRQQRIDNLHNIPNDDNALTLDLPNQERGNSMERLIYKSQIINRIIMDISILGPARNRKERLEWHLKKLHEILVNI